jgi:hypothetical protein
LPCIEWCWRCVGGVCVGCWRCWVVGVAVAVVVAVGGGGAVVVVLLLLLLLVVVVAALTVLLSAFRLAAVAVPVLLGYIHLPHIRTLATIALLRRVIAAMSMS